MKLYTRTGDSGETSLFDGTRVKKHDPRVDAYGEIDELNAWLGFVRASEIDGDLDAELVQIQRDLFALGAQLADPADKIANRVTKAALGDEDVTRLEHLIDRLETEVPPLRRFILAGCRPLPVKRLRATAVDFLETRRRCCRSRASAPTRREPFAALPSASVRQSSTRMSRGLTAHLRRRGRSEEACDEASSLDYFGNAYADASRVRFQSGAHGLRRDGVRRTQSEMPHLPDGEELQGRASAPGLVLGH